MAYYLFRGRMRGRVLGGRRRIPGALAGRLAFLFVVRYFNGHGLCFLHQVAQHLGSHGGRPVVPGAALPQGVYHIVLRAAAEAVNKRLAVLALADREAWRFLFMGRA